MMKGHGVLRRGRWWFYLDSSRMYIGRHADDHSVVYALLGLVAEHYRPEGYAERQLLDRYERTMREWQQVRNAAWRRSEWVIPHEPGESPEDWAERRWDYTCVRYEARAADARACGEPAPTIDMLRVAAPAGVPGTVGADSS